MFEEKYTTADFLKTMDLDSNSILKQRHNFAIATMHNLNSKRELYSVIRANAQFASR